MDVPTELNLEQLRSSGQAPGEQLQPEDSSGPQGQGPAAAAAPAAAPEPDPQLVSALVGMGFSENGSKRAGGWGSTGCSMFYVLIIVELLNA